MKTAGARRTDSAALGDTGLIFSLGVPLSQGFSLFSIPIAAQNNKFFVVTPSTLGTSSQDGLVDKTQVTIAFKFNAATQEFDQIVTGTATNTISPTEAVIVNSSSAHRATLILSQVQSSPPSRTLNQGWNLVSLAVPPDTVTMDADLALISAFVTPTGQVGYTQVVSPAMNPDPFIWTRLASSPPLLTRWRGYWVFMENTDTLAGFSSTPVQP